MSAEPAIGALLIRALAPAEGATGVDDDAVEQGILDAALTEVAAFGTRRTTIDGVAQRAGLARVTVFRRFGSKEALIERLVVRELRRFLADVDAVIAPLDDPGQRVASAFVICVGAARRHPLVARLVGVEPGWALERLGRGDPAPLELARRFVAGHLRARGTPAARHADEVADVLVRLALTYVFLPGPVVEVADDDAARAFALRMLAPLVA